MSRILVILLRLLEHVHMGAHPGLHNIISAAAAATGAVRDAPFAASDAAAIFVKASPLAPSTSVLGPPGLVHWASFDGLWRGIL